MHKGYIKLWRTSFENKHYFAEAFNRYHAWIDLLLLANHKTSTVYVRGIQVTLERGQVLAGEEFLANRWKWSRGKVRRFMDSLSGKTVQQIVLQKNNVCTVITILNYDRFQGNGTTDGTASSTTDGQQTVQQTDTPKNVKNVKNVKNTSMVAKKAATTPQAEFVESFSQLYKAKTGMPFKADKKDFIVVSQLIKKHGLETIVTKAKILAIQCERADQWYCVNGWSDFTIGKLSSCWNSILPIKSKEQRKEDESNELRRQIYGENWDN